jgi:hypothetical protein
MKLCVFRKYGEFLKWLAYKINKILSPNALNENERIWRRRLMKLSAFGEDGEGQKLERISA